LATGGVGSVTRLETEHGGAMTPPTVRGRLADLANAGRLPVLISTTRLHCVVIDPHSWRDQLPAMAAAIHPGAIDPPTTTAHVLAHPPSPAPSRAMPAATHSGATAPATPSLDAPAPATPGAS